MKSIIEILKEMKHDLEANKRNAIEFYRTAYLGEPAKAVEKYVGAEYIQHNPLVADDKQALIDYFEEMARDYPGKSIELVRAVVEGDLVAVHTHQTWPGNEEYMAENDDYIFERHAIEKSLEDFWANC